MADRTEDLVLYGDASWESPWAFHVIVALEELKLTYKLEAVRRPIAPAIKDTLQAHALIGLVPALAHGDFWLTESSAISEYLAETFAPPRYPRIMPAAPRERARARQVMSWLRTSSMGLREDRPTSSVFMRQVTTPLSDKAKRDADELVRIAGQLISTERNSIASEWSMADADLALMLMRLVANSDPVPQRLVDYALAQWRRPSVLKYLAYIPTMH
ncbi:MAG TPA: glutathione transferase [Kofleriaceae bacterium]|nr:glutathione transferase [Kofleriaceae bacterium]